MMIKYQEILYFDRFSLNLFPAQTKNNKAYNNEANETIITII